MFKYLNHLKINKESFMKKMLIPFIFLIFNCYAAELDLTEFQAYITDDESSIYATFTIERGAGLLLTHKKNLMDIQTKKIIVGDCYFLFLDNNNNITSINLLSMNGTDTAVFSNDNFISFIAYNKSTRKSDIVVYDIENNHLEISETEDKYIASIFIFKDWLYYSTENSDYNSIRINLVDGTKTRYPSFPDQRLAGGYFFIQNNRILKNCAKKIYDITDGTLVKTDLVQVPLDEDLRLVDFSDGDFSEYMFRVKSFLSNHGY